jgi:hypothetical protein
LTTSGTACHTLLALTSSYFRWLETAECSGRVLIEREIAVSTQAPGDGGLSLVALPENASEGPQTVLVQWTSPGAEGRVADLDSEFRVKCIVAVGNKRVPLKLSHAEIIHPSTGVFMERTRGRKGAERPALVPDMLRLLRMWRIAQQRTCGEDTAATSVDVSLSCALCSAAECSDSALGACKQCAVCMLFWHPSCAEEVVQCQLTPRLQAEAASSSSSSSSSAPQPRPNRAPTKNNLRLPAVFTDMTSGTQPWPCHDVVCAVVHCCSML